MISKKTAITMLKSISLLYQAYPVSQKMVEDIKDILEFVEANSKDAPIKDEEVITSSSPAADFA